MADANARLARVDAWLIPGLGRTIAITNPNGTDWPADTYVHFGPLSASTGAVVPTITAKQASVAGAVATVTLTEANVASILAAYPHTGVARCPWHIRTGAGTSGDGHATGYLGWDLNGSDQSATVVATVMLGPTGPTPGLMIGTVTTLPAGEAATATLTETTPDTYELDLGIPSGAAGPLGTTVTLVDNGDGTWTLNYGDVDTTPPGPGTLAASSVTQSGFTLTATGASDETALHATPYAFSLDVGATWTDWQEAATYVATGLTAGTEYTCQHKVRDAQGNEAEGATITQSTSAGIAFGSLITGTVASNQGAATVDLSTATAGQTALVFIQRYSSATDPTATPSGWTSVGKLEFSTTTATWLYRKTLGAGDLGAATWTWASNTKTLSLAVTYSGVTSVGTHAGVVNGAYSTSILFPTLTTDAAWVVGIGGGYNTLDETLTPPAEYTSRGTVGNTDADLWAIVMDTNGTHPGGATTPTVTASPNVNSRLTYLVPLT